jgi:putative tricarboxylic transport membrane protein
MVGFGIVGFLLRRMNYPLAPLVLGIILGDLLDKNLRRGLTLSDGSLEPFFFRPISAGLAAACVLTVMLSVPAVRRGLGAVLGRPAMDTGRDL